MTGITLLGMDDTIGRRLRRLRKSRDWNQEKLSVVSEVSSSTIARLERDEIESGVETLGRLAKALDVELAELMGHTEATEPRKPYDSLQSFLERHPKMRITPSERAWLSRPLPDDLDIGDDEFWMTLLLAYRQQVKLFSAEKQSPAPGPEERRTRN